MGATTHGPNYFRDELGCAVDSRTRVLRFFGSFATRRPVRFRLPATVPLFCRSRCQVAYFITYDKNIYGTFRELPIVLCRVARVPLPARSARPSARGRAAAGARAAHARGGRALRARRRRPPSRYTNIRPRTNPLDILSCAAKNEQLEHYTSARRETQKQQGERTIAH